MIVRVSTFSSSSIACLSFLSWGRKASKANRLVDLPEMISALMQAAGPGMGVTVIPASWHIRTSSSPDRKSPAFRIGDQRHAFACQHLLHQVLSFFDLVVFMIAGHGRMNVKVIQQLDAVTGILGGDQIGLLKERTARKLISSRLPMGVAHKYSFPAIELLLSSISINIIDLIHVNAGRWYTISGFSTVIRDGRPCTPR